MRFASFCCRHYWNRSALGTRGVSAPYYGLPIVNGYRIRAGYFRYNQRGRGVLDNHVNDTDWAVWHVFRSVDLIRFFLKIIYF